MTLPTGLDPRTPVLVGAATVTQHLDDPSQADGALELMRRAARAAAHDAAGQADLLSRLDAVLVPKGIWDHADPGRALGAAFGSTPHTVLAEIGVLQQTPITWACQAIAAGQLDVALVAGGEDKFRQLRGLISGVTPAGPDPALASAAAGVPDETWQPEGEILSRVEIERDLAVPAQQYALIEQALRHAEGRDDAATAERLGALWARFAAVATTWDGAWDRSAPSPEEIARPAAANRMLSTPYTKHLCSQWNVDQAAALLLTSAGTADAAGVPRDRWVFPWAVAESNVMIVLPRRAQLHRSEAVAEVGRALVDRIEALGSLAEVDLVDLYSCFPAAVGVQARELGIDEQRPLTVTGGMTFGGGPLNNYALMSTAVMARRLRDEAGRTGLVTAVSGMITKTGAALWGARPPARPFAAHDVTRAVRAATETRVLDPDATGAGTIVAATVIHEGGEPARVVAIVDTAEATRTVAVCRDPATAAELVRGDHAGRAVTLTSPGAFVPH